MTTYVKVNGAWQPATAVYTKVGGTWQPATAVYTKVGGAWSSGGSVDTTPPGAPQLVAAVDPSNKFLFVQTGTASNDTDLDLIRVLVRTDAFPTSPTGAGYVSTVPSNFPSETWSDWVFNSGGAHSTTVMPTASEATVKYYPANAFTTAGFSGAVLPSGTYYFTAWARDKAGNWGAPTSVSVWMPPQVVVPQYTQITKTYKAVASKTYLGSGATRTDVGAFTMATGYDSRYGQQKAVVWFPNVQISNDLSAAISIDNVSLYLKAGTWENSTGGYGRIAFTNIDRNQATYTVNSGTNWNFFQDVWFTPNQERWFNITDDGTRFWKSGQRQGIAIGPAPSTANMYHGLFRDHTAIAAPELRITYTVRV